MRVDFSRINKNTIINNKAVFFYGNYQDGAMIFWEIILKIIKKGNVNSFCVLASEFVKSDPSGEQIDLFSAMNAYYIKNAEDAHLKFIQNFIEKNHNAFFVIQAGDFRKSKKITDYFTKHEKYASVASFNNPIGIESIIKFITNKVSAKFFPKIFGAINGGTESLFSLMQKIEILETEENIAYYLSNVKFSLEIEAFEPIGLIRFLMFHFLKSINEGRNFADYVNGLFFKSPNSNLKICCENAANIAKFLTEYELKCKGVAGAYFSGVGARDSNFCVSVIYQKLLSELCSVK